jgi:pyruvate dehydrogenase E1 component beta subunit
MPWTKLPAATCEPLGPYTPELRQLSYAEALCEAQRQILLRDESAFLLGEGVDDCGAVFGSTLGLAEEFGPRVMDTPIAENGLTGVAIGAALAGMRPIFVHMRSDFLPMCMDQLLNHAAKWRYMTGGLTSVPLVVRSIIGRGWGSAAQHSQGLHNLFLGVPGLRIALPSTPYDAKGLLFAAMADGNPVLFFEHRWLYGNKGCVPQAPYIVPFGKAAVRREGGDITLVAVSHMVQEACLAADLLAEQGISAEVLDLRTIAPLDMAAVERSVRKTGRLVVADCSWTVSGVGAEIAFRLVESDPGILRAPVARVGFPNHPTPSSPVLEQAYYPGPQDIQRVAMRLLHP